jgi:hypothetical protein
MHGRVKHALGIVHGELDEFAARLDLPCERGGHGKGQRCRNGAEIQVCLFQRFSKTSFATGSAEKALGQPA